MMNNILLPPSILNTRQACHVSQLANIDESEKIFWSGLMNYLNGLTVSNRQIKAFPIESISDADRNEVLFKNTGPQRFFGSIKLDCGEGNIVVSNHDDKACRNTGGTSYNIRWDQCTRYDMGLYIKVK